MSRVDTDGSTLKLDIGSSAVWDDRMPGEPYSAQPDNMECNRPRLPLGAFLLDNFAIDSSTFAMKMRLWDAEVSGSAADIDAADGSLGWRVFAHAVYDDADVVAVELTFNTTGVTEPMPTWRFQPADANRYWSARQCYGRNASFPANPPARNATEASDGAQVFTQDHLSGSEHSTAFIVLPTTTTTVGGVTVKTSIMYVSTSEVLPRGEGDAAALASVRSAVKLGIASLTASHRAWWHAYYPAGGFVTLANPQLESFYWTQMYKIASATRADRELYDLMGPWGVTPTSWPDVHWDLNIQLTHWVFFTANRIDLVRSLTSRLDANTPTLINNVPVAWRNDSAAGPSDDSSPRMMSSCGPIGGRAYNGTCLVATGSKPTAVGNLLWTLQSWHNVYRYNGYDGVELAALFPLLARAVTYYSHITHTNSSAGMDPTTLHLDATVSPEYGSAVDVNYDIALLKWGLGALLDAAAKGLPAAINDTRLPLWKDMSTRLTTYTTDAATGFMIGEGLRLDHGHRHFSHLLMIYPLKQLDLDGNATERALAEQSLDHWMGLGNLHGFSYTGASPMNVLLGRKEQAFGNITNMMSEYIESNTMYFEGKAYPCGETPPAAASAIMDWMLMEAQGVVRVFAGIDDAELTDVAFDRLLAPGGFEFSASRAAGKTSFVTITNVHGVALNDMATLSILVDGMALPWKAAVGPAFGVVKFQPRADGSGIVDIDLSTLKKGATVTLYSLAAPVEVYNVVPSEGGNQSMYNYWGLPKGGAPPPAPTPAPVPQICTTGTVCATKFSGNGEGCCPYENAVCCDNAMTCCPSGSACKVGGWQSTCVGAPAAQAVGKPICKTGAPLPFSKTLPNVLVIGDSVSIGYTPKIAAHMAPIALVQHSPWDIRDGGAEETAYGVACLQYFFHSPKGVVLKPDVIMFNWCVCVRNPRPSPRLVTHFLFIAFQIRRGLHDGPLQNKTEPGQYGLPDVYASQLENITIQIKQAQPQAKLLFAGTTPYMCAAQNDGCVVNLNNQAAAVMARHGIPTLNLHDVITGECGPPPNSTCFGQHGCFCPHCSPADGVGYEFLAVKSIVPALTALLPKAGAMSG
jgi:hypothetical protein